MTPAQATRRGGTLIERWAQLDAMIVATEAARNDRIARANLEADAALAPLTAEIAAVRGKIEAWWAAGGKQLLPEGRKTFVFAGCELGTRKGRAKLGIVREGVTEDAVVSALRAKAWGAPYLRVTYSIDKAAALKGLDGTDGKKLGGLGLAKLQGEEFVLKREVQDGTIAGEGAR
ncbi:host-nuclease inhibitor Gam family protein [Sphingomonas canadensis]|uniref:Host-nuclease inhibitor Gam family protein n=1 Tax=Sphingomonas canadensis TaxID=1219257 RepID=A0ABW3HEN0_9SPHN|nr:host-nuclease inhibitor Gam family protein [Sphingomonas canadensis]MCW3837827.1 host-nuclease inhibitor Gam family protein [Sphingomonas canadensis]